MIIVKLKGGLGNQMFQYACGRAVAHRLKLPLKLDITSFENNDLRSYKLSAYNIIENFATKHELQQLVKKNFFQWCKQKIFNEKAFHFDPDILKIKSDVYLDGYWQSEKYFADISDIIHKEFTVKTEPAGLNRQILEKIDSVNSVSIHVRRGDYLTNPLASKILGVLSPDYYSRSIGVIISKVINPVLFVFSDDIQWAEENIKTSLPITFLNHNSLDNDFEDIRLMNHCKHHIIANSSFSWWGAWLNNATDKVIIAPEKWFNECLENTADLIPNKWLKI